ncbi:hypothetical protein [Thalassoglobus neptunius]|uniref:hypothetical protein n=1 Tax=Thalassoglobus neptunius TaxID=1938619 RepID=UPI0018D20ADD|nr:hypothetical protein [Thalassoglobus neptunius]
MVTATLLLSCSVSSAEDRLANLKVKELGLELKISYDDANGDKLRIKGSFGTILFGVPVKASLDRSLGKNSGGSYEFIDKRTISGVGVKFVFYFEPKKNGMRFVGRIEGRAAGKRVYIPGPNHKHAITKNIKW